SSKAPWGKSRNWSTRRRVPRVLRNRICERAKYTPRCQAMKHYEWTCTANGTYTLADGTRPSVAVKEFFNFVKDRKEFALKQLAGCRSQPVQARWRPGHVQHDQTRRLRGPDCHPPDDVQDRGCEPGGDAPGQRVVAPGARERRKGTAHLAGRCVGAEGCRRSRVYHRGRFPGRFVPEHLSGRPPGRPWMTSKSSSRSRPSRVAALLRGLCSRSRPPRRAGCATTTGSASGRTTTSSRSSPSRRS